jgi:hypothetical protein
VSRQHAAIVISVTASVTVFMMEMVCALFDNQKIIETI